MLQEEPSDSILDYVFPFGTKSSDLKNLTSNGNFFGRVKEYALSGGEFHCSLAIYLFSLTQGVHHTGY